MKEYAQHILEVIEASLTMVIGMSTKHVAL